MYILFLKVMLLRKKIRGALPRHFLAATLSVLPRLASVNLFLQKWPTTPVMVNFMWQHHWTMGCPDILLTLFLDVSVRGFLEEISIWIGGLSKADGLPKVRGHHTMC